MFSSVFANWGSIVAILIGLVTLSGAFLTWKSVDLNGNATDSDRQTVVQTIAIEKNKTYADSELAVEDLYFERVKASLVAAEHLEILKKSADDKNLPSADALARDEELHQNISDALRYSGVLDQRYVHGDDSQSLTFDVDKRRADLQSADPYSGDSTANPDASRHIADQFHSRSLRLIGFVVALAAVIVLLTVSQLTASWPRAVLGTAGTVGWIVITVVALVGDHA